MASSSDVVKKVMRLKLQLTDTVLKILQKLKDLDITLDILAETGIGKAVNSLRRHEQAGEFAKSLVKGWKKLVPKECSSQESSDEVFLKTESGKTASLKQQCEQQKGKENENGEKSQQENQNIFQNDIMEKEIGEDQIDVLFASKKKNDQSDRKSGDGDTLLGNNSEDTHQRSRSDSREKPKSNSDDGGFWPEKESNKKSKPSKESSKEDEESFSFESSDKNSKTLKLANAREDRSSGKSRSTEDQKRKRNKTSKERHVGPEHKQESEIKGNSKHKNKKEPSKSFESYLNYDVNVFKRKERCGVKRAPRKIKTGVKEEAAKDSGMKLFKSPVMSITISPPKQVTIILKVFLVECSKHSCIFALVISFLTFILSAFKVERESDFCDASEDSAVFTGQRLNKKMQVYSGAKTVFLPTMMSLYQQCIRILQNNINLLYETGGVPFEILEPVLERCTPEQLLRIEECNPIYIGVSDHIWGRHCQRDFKDSKLQEYESWKEMYIRLSEERERKLQRLTKSIVSAHSKKPKGRQVKMAFIHTVAKPPRDVRIQQEIHGTAVQQPHQPRFAPMMAKSLKAFKKQFGRR
uniref:Elongin A, like n=1 Tax=Seriola lalandi dorsalis TaxID=1841481 RepID=A0A3B4WIF7_SERLL